MMLLIDADVVAYKAAQVIEEAIEWEPGFWTWHVDADRAVDTAERWIDQAVETVGADGYQLALTDTAWNWRKDILPTYKENRKGGKKPLALIAIREHLIANLGALVVPSLEGDDILGVWATGSHKGDSIVWSIDKDLKTIPCRYLRDLESDVLEISEPEANWWHLYQALTGDTTDGYSGCPGIGPKRAQALLPDDGKIDSKDISAIWKDVIVPAYVKAKSSAEEALVQAQVARILRKGEYSKKRGVRPWTPEG
jgi:DNA polymerase-1